MAKCEKRKTKVKPLVYYVLTLTEAEAVWLERGIGRLIGPADTGDDIYNALADALGHE